jgi:hypothetical protein
LWLKFKVTLISLETMKYRNIENITSWAKLVISKTSQPFQLIKKCNYVGVIWINDEE